MDIPKTIAVIMGFVLLFMGYPLASLFIFVFLATFWAFGLI